MEDFREEKSADFFEKGRLFFFGLLPVVPPAEAEKNTLPQTPNSSTDDGREFFFDSPHFVNVENENEKKI